MKTLFTHWKTTCTGLTMIAGAAWTIYEKHATLDQTTFMACIGAILTGLGFVFASDGSQSPPPGGSGTANVCLVGAIALLAFGAVGCSGLNRQAFNAENAAAVTADAGMRSYGVYWEKAWHDTNAWHTTYANLVDQRRQVENISVKIGSSIALCESLRASYATNAAVEPQLRAALTALAQNTGQIVPYINSFLTINTNYGN